MVVDILWFKKDVDFLRKTAQLCDPWELSVMAETPKAV